MIDPAHKFLRALCALTLASALVPVAAFADDFESMPDDAPLPAQAAAQSDDATGPEADSSDDADAAAVPDANEEGALNLGVIEEDSLQTLETTVEEETSLLARFLSFFGARATSPVQLAAGNHEKWVDRIDDTGRPYVREFYNGLIAASDNNGVNDILIEDKYLTLKESDAMPKVSPSTQVGQPCLVQNKENPSTVYPTILAAKIPADQANPDDDATVQAYLTETYGAFDRDNPQCFWRNRQFALTDAVQQDDQYRYYGFILMASVRNGDGSLSPWNPRSAEYASESDIKAAIGQYDGAIASITGGMTAADKASDYAKVKYLNDWVVDNNHYNRNSLSSLEAARKMCAWSALSALTSADGEKAPVCEGYARALQALCLEVGVHCTLADGHTTTSSPDGTGQQNGEPHMWNNVQVDGAWYGADPTWGKSYLLVGSDKLDQTRTMSNKFMSDGLSFINGPQLSAADYVNDTSKQDPTVTTPTGLTAAYGKTLSDIRFGALPAGDTRGSWAWSDPTMSVGAVGTRTFPAVFTPEDTSTYRSVTRDVAVTVEPRQVTASINVTGGSTTYTGRPIEPKVEVIVAGTTLPTSAYQVSYRDNVNAGTATVQVTPAANGNYTFEPVTSTFVIGKAQDHISFSQSLTSNPQLTLNDGPIALSASCASGITDIAFSIESGDAAAIVTSTGSPSLKAVRLGTAVVRAESQGNGNYDAASTTCTVTVKAPEFSAPSGLTAMPSKNPDYRIAAKGGLGSTSLDKLTTASSLFEADADDATKQAVVASELVSATRTVMPSVRADQTAVYDVSLFKLTQDGTGEWGWSEVQDASDFPSEGIEVSLGFPVEGLSVDTHSFAVAHMFTTSMGGFAAGQVETPQVTVDEYGVHFTVNGFSPMSVSWQEGVGQSSSQTGTTFQAGVNSTSGASGNLAQTGDSLPLVIGALVAVIVVAAIACALVVARRRKARQATDQPIE